MMEVEQMERLGSVARLPSFSLPSTEGQEIGPQDLRQRKHLVLALIRDPQGRRGRALVQELSEICQRLQAVDGAVLVVVGGDPEVAQALHEELAPPFPFLFDPDDRAARLCLGERVDGRPALLVLDRFGVVWAHLQASSREGIPGGREALEQVRFIAMQCPE